MKRLVHFSVMLAALVSASIAFPADKVAAGAVLKSAGIRSIFFQTAYGYGVSPAAGANGFTVGATMGGFRLRRDAGRTVDDGSPPLTDSMLPTVGKSPWLDLFSQNASILENKIVGAFAFSAATGRGEEQSGFLAAIAPAW